MLPLPVWLEVPLAVLLMDYTLYLWHVLMHRLNWLWRFHLPHHVDLDLDASTALRFHFSDLVISIAWRAGQVTLIGVSPLSLSVWQTLLLLSILFHHSNVPRQPCKLPTVPMVPAHTIWSSRILRRKQSFSIC
jgi:sterol desaturase/sphingolipid hydroxylase (fatty acid hydroxylase superfamily)